ncbi:MAG: NAD-dependent epimerase/dehydratase family protein [Parcubacteria group bacterium]|jgi:UDP-glucose 4-epimerase
MTKKKDSILILGADGFLGSNLALSLAKEERFNLRAFDLFKNGLSNNLESIRNDIKLIQGNFLNKEDLKTSLNGIDYVFHFISLTTPSSSSDDPFIEIDTNIRSTLELLDECVKAGIKRIIFASTGGAIYGDQAKSIYSERDVTNPISPYAISKLAIEKYLEYYRIRHGLSYLILRYSNPYGPHQNLVGSQGIIPIFLNQIFEGRPVTIFGDGENIRDYIFVDDIIDITKKIFKKKTEHNLYNIGNGKGITINMLLDAMRDITGKKIKIKWQPKREIDIRKIVLDTKRIKMEMGDFKLTSLGEGIKKTWEWISQQKSLKR